MSIIENVLDAIAKKRPSSLLDPKLANTLYNTVPTDSAEFVGLNKIMGRKTSLTDTVKFTALEPVKGLMNSVPMGTRTPVKGKQARQSEQKITVRWAESNVFSPTEIQQIELAVRNGSPDAEIKLAAEEVINAIVALKYKRDCSFEKVFWDGCYQQSMYVPQEIDNVASYRYITTDTRTLTDLAGNFRWNIAAASSTADVTSDVRAMKRSYSGKGTELETIYMNQLDFDYATTTANATTGMRPTYSQTTLKLESESLVDGINVAGVKLRVYDANWITTAGTSTKYIPNGYIIGVAKKMNGRSHANLYNALNIDGKLLNNGNGVPVYGSFFRTKTGEENDSPSTRLVLTHCGSPVFDNPQAFARLKVY